MKAKREVGGWEDGQRFDKDVGDGFVFCEVRIELVPNTRVNRYFRAC